MIKNKTLAIVGPTAVGKTSLTLRLAQLLRSEIISCDSVQLFKDLNIGSAKPSRQELDLVPHHLISQFSPLNRINVSVYKKTAEKVIVDLQQRSHIPIVSGGTGMYFNALYYGLFSQQSQDKQYRLALEEKVLSGDLDDLYRELLEKDPRSAQNINASDKVRIIRALEVYKTSGRSILDLQQENEKLDLDWFIIGLDRERSRLYERIELRVDDMLEQGLIQETKDLLEKYGQEAYGLGSIGYRHVKEYLQGLYDHATMVDTLKRDTRRYAKRQLTWFRKNKDIHWYHPDDEDTIIKDVEGFLS